MRCWSGWPCPPHPQARRLPGAEGHQPHPLDALRAGGRGAAARAAVPAQGGRMGPCWLLYWSRFHPMLLRCTGRPPSCAPLAPPQPRRHLGVGQLERRLLGSTFDYTGLLLGMSPVRPGAPRACWAEQGVQRMDADAEMKAARQSRLRRAAPPVPQRTAGRPGSGSSSQTPPCSSKRSRRSSSATPPCRLRPRPASRAAGRQQRPPRLRRPQQQMWQQGRRKRPRRWPRRWRRQPSRRRLRRSSSRMWQHPWRRERGRQHQWMWTKRRLCPPQRCSCSPRRYSCRCRHRRSQSRRQDRRRRLRRRRRSPQAPTHSSSRRRSSRRSHHPGCSQSRLRRATGSGTGCSPTTPAASSRSGV